jgi:plastocyanin
MRNPLWTYFLLFAALACSEEAVASRGRVIESSAGTVELGIEGRGYTPGPVANASGLAGNVSATATPADSLIAVARDQRVCGDSAVVRRVRLNGTSLANALVWVEGITAGKPLPDARRATVTIDKCNFDPKVSAVVSGSTINVLSRDRASHDVRFYREGDGTPVASILTVDAGQVVPTEHIAAKAGIVEARCQAHPWVRAYVAVFDHPYFAVTDEKGAFSMEQLPAGSYTVKVWHEGMEQAVEQRVTVGAGGTGQLQLQVALK